MINTNPVIWEQVENRELFLDTGTKIPYKGIVGENDNIFSVVSPKYKLIKHQELIEHVEGTLDKNGLLAGATRTIKFDKGQGRMRTEYVFKDREIPVNLGNGDELIHPKLDIFNSYDLSWAQKALLGAFRLICTNGMIVGKKMASFRKIHTQNFRIEDLLLSLENGIEELNSVGVIWKDWTEEELTPAIVEEELEYLGLTEKEKTGILIEPEVSSMIMLQSWMKWQKEVLTRWLFFNILTQYITHRVVSETRRVALENAVSKNFYKGE